MRADGAQEEAILLDARLRGSDRRAQSLGISRPSQSGIPIIKS